MQLRVRWHITPQVPPRVWRHCGHCGAKRPFVSSGKFRSNAQKKRLDVWLIYRCAACGQTWNYPLFERCAVSEIDPPLFQAITGNCAETARRYACDLARLRSYADRVELCESLRVEKVTLGDGVAAPDELAIALVLTEPCDLRLERLLARELAVSRNALRRLHDKGALRVTPAGRAVLRQPIRDGQNIAIDLQALAEGTGLARAIAQASRESAHEGDNR